MRKKKTKHAARHVVLPSALRVEEALSHTWSSSKQFFLIHKPRNEDFKTRAVLLRSECLLPLLRSKVHKRPCVSLTWSTGTIFKQCPPACSLDYINYLKKSFWRWRTSSIIYKLLSLQAPKGETAKEHVTEFKSKVINRPSRQTQQVFPHPEGRTDSHLEADTPKFSPQEQTPILNLLVFLANPG